MNKRKLTNISASVRQRLLNVAQERKEDFQLVLVRYGIERLLYRLSLSPHAKQFVLKGAMLFQLWTGQPHRSTQDVDLLGSGEPDIDRLVKILRDVCVQQVDDDGLTFVPDTVQGGLIREDQRYGGIRLHLMAKLDNARIPLQIDIGFGDAVTPSAVQVEYPTLLGPPAPIIRAYQKVTAIAEKYEAMVNLGIANSRMKDFYDIWVLAREFDFEGDPLAQAIRATFTRRATALPVTPPTALTQAFAEDRAKQTQWSAFVRRGRLAVEVPAFGEVVTVIRSFLWPASEALLGDKDFDARWPAGGPWK